MDKANLKKIVKKFIDIRVAVIGDFVLDEYILGMTSRVSREAPVLILKYDSTRIFLGSAGNTANNIHSLGAKVFPIGIIGDDQIGELMMKIMGDAGIDYSGMYISSGRKTPIKTRILAGGLNTTKQQVIRIDRDDDSKLTIKEEDNILDRLNSLFPRVEAILVSDYGNGLMTDKIVKHINTLTDHRDKIITVDSRFNILKFKAITSATPNEPEVEDALRVVLNNERDVEKAGLKLLNKIKSKSLLITRGRKGMALFEPNKRVKFIPIFGSDEVSDVTGAGDTVIGTFTLSLSAEAKAVESAKIATYAASIVVSKSGTAVASQKEILDVIDRDEDKD